MHWEATTLADGFAVYQETPESSYLMQLCSRHNDCRINSVAPGRGFANADRLPHNAGVDPTPFFLALQ